MVETVCRVYYVQVLVVGQLKVIDCYPLDSHKPNMFWVLMSDDNDLFNFLFQFLGQLHDVNFNSSQEGIAEIRDQSDVYILKHIFLISYFCLIWVWT